MGSDAFFDVRHGNAAGAVCGGDLDADGGLTLGGGGVHPLTRACGGLDRFAGFERVVLIVGDGNFHIPKWTPLDTPAPELFVTKLLLTSRNIFDNMLSITCYR